MQLFKKKAVAEEPDELDDIEDDVIESNFVPYACHWDENTLLTKNGEVFQTIKLSDMYPRHAGADETDLRAKIREALSAIDSVQYAVWIHTIRRKASFQAEGEFRRDFAGYLDRFWKDRNDWEHKFINEVYVTVVREGQPAGLFSPVGLVRQLIPRIDIRHRERVIDESAEKLTRITDRMLDVLASYGAKKLGIYKKDDIWYSEPCTFLGKLTTLQEEPRPLEQISIADYITDCDVTFGYNAMEVRMKKDGKRRFGAYITIKEYRELPLDSLDTVLKMSHEFILTQCFIFTDAKNALKNYDYQKKLFEMSNSSSLAARSGLNAILNSDRGRDTDFCEQQVGIFLIAESIKTLDSNVAKTVSTLGTQGLIPMREDLALEECYWAMQPANFQCIKRFKPLNTSSMGGFANLNFLPCGQAENNLWGAPVTTFHTITRTPYFFNFHVGDNGHTILLGPPNAGKKVLMNFLIAQARKFDGKLFYFDRERLAEAFVRSIDGTYHNPYPGADPRPYVQLAMNPLQMDDTQPNRDFLERWLLMLAGAAASAELAVSARKVVATIMTTPKEVRKLSSCAEMLSKENPAWTAALSPWLEGGKHAAVFGSETDSFPQEGKVHGFEMESLVHNRDAFIPVFAYLMHRIVQSLDGKPAMLVLDEAWDLIDTPLLAPRLTGWLQALRKKNAMVLLASEQIDTVKEHPLNAELFGQVATKIFLPDDSADISYTDAFGLSVKDIAFLTAMNTDDRNFLVVRGQESVVLELDLSGMVDIVSVLASTPFHLQKMEQAIVARGISPSQWMPKFLESI